MGRRLIKLCALLSWLFASSALAQTCPSSITSIGGATSCWVPPSSGTTISDLIDANPLTIASDSTYGLKPSNTLGCGTGSSTQPQNINAGCDITSALSFTPPATPSSLTLVIKFSGTGGPLAQFGSTSSVNAPFQYYQLYLDTYGRLTWGAYNYGVLNAIQSGTPDKPKVYADGNPHIAVASIGANGMRLYVDGALVSSNNITLSNYSQGFWLFGNAGLVSGPNSNTWPYAPAQAWFNGTLYYWAWWNGTQLTDVQARALSNQGANPPSPIANTYVTLTGQVASLAAQQGLAYANLPITFKTDALQQPASCGSTLPLAPSSTTIRTDAQGNLPANLQFPQGAHVVMTLGGGIGGPATPLTMPCQSTISLAALIPAQSPLPDAVGSIILAGPLYQGSTVANPPVGTIGPATITSPPTFIQTGSSTPGGTITVDRNNGAQQDVTLQSNSNITFANLLDGGPPVVVDVIEGVSGPIPTFVAPGGFTLAWPGGSQPTQVTTAGTRTYYSFTVEGTAIFGAIATASSGTANMFPLSATANFNNYSGVNINDLALNPLGPPGSFICTPTCSSGPCTTSYLYELTCNEDNSSHTLTTSATCSNAATLSTGANNTNLLSWTPPASGGGNNCTYSVYGRLPASSGQIQSLIATCPTGVGSSGCGGTAGAPTWLDNGTALASSTPPPTTNTIGAILGGGPINGGLGTFTGLAGANTLTNFSLLNGYDINAVIDGGTHGMVASSQISLATVAPLSSTLTLSQVGDWQPNQYYALVGAGAPATISAPQWCSTSTSGCTAFNYPVQAGATGLMSYSYCVETLDSANGESVCNAVRTVTNGNPLLGPANYVIGEFLRVAGAQGYIVKSCRGAGCTPKFLHFVPDYAASGQLFNGFADVGETYSAPEQIGRGDNSTTSFSFTLAGAPLDAGSLAVVAGGVTCIDSGSATFTASGSCNAGSITYASGVITVSFVTAPAKGTNIWAEYTPTNNYPIANSSATRDWVFGTVVSGQGTTTLTGSGPIPSGGASGVVRMFHDSGTPLQAALTLAGQAYGNTVGGREVKVPAGWYFIPRLLRYPSNVTLTGVCAGTDFGTGAAASTTTGYGTTFAWAGPDELDMFDLYDGLRERLMCGYFDTQLAYAGAAPVSSTAMTAIHADASLTSLSGNDKMRIQDVGIVGAHHGVNIGGNVINDGAYPSADISEFVVDQTHTLMPQSFLNSQPLDKRATGFWINSSNTGFISAMFEPSCLGGSANVCIDQISDNGLYVDRAQGAVSNGASPSFHVYDSNIQGRIEGSEIENSNAVTGYCLRSEPTATGPGSLADAGLLFINNICGGPTGGNNISLDQSIVVKSSLNSWPNTPTFVQANASGVVVDSSYDGAPWTNTTAGGTIEHSILNGISQQNVADAFGRLTVMPSVSQFAQWGENLQLINPSGSSLNWQIDADRTANNHLRITPSTTNGGSTFSAPVLDLTSSYAQMPAGALNKLGSAPGAAIGAGACEFFAVAGAGSACNLEAICGTSTTPVIFATNVGSGC